MDGGRKDGREFKLTQGEHLVRVTHESLKQRFVRLQISSVKSCLSNHKRDQPPLATDTNADSRAISPWALGPRTLGPRTLSPKYFKSQGPEGRGPKIPRTSGPRPLGPWDLGYMGPKVRGPKAQGLDSPPGFSNI